MAKPLLAALGVGLQAVGTYSNVRHAEQQAAIQQRAQEAKNRMEMYLANRELDLKERSLDQDMYRHDNPTGTALANLEGTRMTTDARRHETDTRASTADKDRSWEREQHATISAKDQASLALERMRAETGQVEADAKVMDALEKVRAGQYDDFDDAALKLFTRMPEAPPATDGGDDISALVVEAQQPELDSDAYAIAQQIKSLVMEEKIPLAMAQDAADWMREVSPGGGSKTSKGRVRDDIGRYLTRNKAMPSPEETRVYEATGQFPDQHPRQTWDEVAGAALQEIEQKGMMSGEGKISANDFRDVILQIHARMERSGFKMPSQDIGTWWDRNRDTVQSMIMDAAGGVPTGESRRDDRSSSEVEAGAKSGSMFPAEERQKAYGIRGRQDQPNWEPRPF